MPTIMSPQGMVVTPHYLASQVAFSILKKGGNAIEASIAAASTLSVVYPHMRRRPAADPSRIGNKDCGFGV